MRHNKFLKTLSALGSLRQQKTQQRFKNFALKRHRSAVVDQGRIAHARQFFLEVSGLAHGSGGRTLGQFGNLGYVEKKFIPEKSTHRRVGAWIERLVQEARQHRQRGDRVAIQFADIINQRRQVGKVAGAPTLCRPERIERTENAPTLAVCIGGRVGPLRRRKKIGL